MAAIVVCTLVAVAAAGIGVFYLLRHIRAKKQSSDGWQDPARYMMDAR
jgi:hypothetical protein